jgi:Carboxypeptidase regulatory-like domain
MKTIVRSFVAVLCAAASVAFGALPKLNVTVADSAGKGVYKGTTNATGAFATGTLPPGKYVVQFNANGVKGGNYALVVSAGSKKVTADSITGEKFSKGGVAMKIDVASGSNITGMVTTGVQLQTKVDKDGKKLVWIPKKLGSNLPGHWAPEDSPEAKELESANQINSKTLQQYQNPGPNVTRPKGG